MSSNRTPWPATTSDTLTKRSLSVAKLTGVVLGAVLGEEGIGDGEEGCGAGSSPDVCLTGCFAGETGTSTEAVSR